jgi:hypothetical protein
MTRNLKKILYVYEFGFWTLGPLAQEVYILTGVLGSKLSNIISIQKGHWQTLEKQLPVTALFPRQYYAKDFVIIGPGSA